MWWKVFSDQIKRHSMLPFGSNIVRRRQQRLFLSIPDISLNNSQIQKYLDLHPLDFQPLFNYKHISNFIHILSSFVWFHPTIHDICQHCYFKKNCFTHIHICYIVGLIMRLAKLIYKSQNAKLWQSLFFNFHSCSDPQLDKSATYCCIPKLDCIKILHYQMYTHSRALWHPCSP